MEEKVGTSGWIRNGDGTLYRWTKQRPHSLILIGVDPLSITQLTDEWLSENSDTSSDLASVLESSGAASVRLVGLEGSVIEQAGLDVPFGSNSARFPASIRFGTWLGEGVGRSTTVRVRNWPWFFAGQGIAVALLVASLFAATALRHANRLARQRVSFVNRASHELRSPITNMMLNVDLAREMIDEDPGGAERRLARVSDEAGRLSRLVDNLLTFSRSENGVDRIRVEKIDPSQVLDEVLGQFEMSLRDRKIEVSWEKTEPVQVSADPDSLAQVFGNLLSNVEKYAASGERLFLVESVEEEYWRIEFRDVGPGIPERRREQIFEPFLRGDDAIDEGVSGTGLGLTIARDLCRRMEGELQLMPSTNGAIFRVQLPLTKS